VTREVILPESYRRMPRWWHGGQPWLEALPGLVASTCARWELEIDGEPFHGSNALVLPVRRAGIPLALRLEPPDDETAAGVRALRFWDGRGTVRLVEADPARGISLLERLHGEDTLASRPLGEAIPAIARLARQLAIPAPSDVPFTGDIVRERLATMPGEWERLGRPFARAILEAALRAGATLIDVAGDLAVNGDLHCAQVLRADRDPGWLVVDPVLLRGDIAYDLARVLWDRLDEMADAAAIRHWLVVLAREAGLDPAHVREAVRYRTVDYWLWGLGYGLTEDPRRCARLVEAVVGEE
jgi:streptomycin 6-kinase